MHKPFILPIVGLAPRAALRLYRRAILVVGASLLVLGGILPVMLAAQSKPVEVEFFGVVAQVVPAILIAFVIEQRGRASGVPSEQALVTETLDAWHDVIRLGAHKSMAMWIWLTEHPDYHHLLGLNPRMADAEIVMSTANRHRQRLAGEATVAATALVLLILSETGALLGVVNGGVGPHSVLFALVAAAFGGAGTAVVVTVTGGLWGLVLRTDTAARVYHRLPHGPAVTE